MRSCRRCWSGPSGPSSPSMSRPCMGNALWRRSDSRTVAPIDPLPFIWAQHGPFAPLSEVFLRFSPGRAIAESAFHRELDAHGGERKPSVQSCRWDAQWSFAGDNARRPRKTVLRTTAVRLSTFYREAMRDALKQSDLLPLSQVRMIKNSSTPGASRISTFDLQRMQLDTDPSIRRASAQMLESIEYRLTQMIY
jgi:hypothetical protein